MDNLNAWSAIALIWTVGWTAPLYYARKRLYRNDELFLKTPEHQMEKVENEHVKTWKRMAFIFFAFPFVVMVINAAVHLYAGAEIEHMFAVAETQLMFPTLAVGAAFIYDAKLSAAGTIWDRTPYLVTQFMVYPEKKISALLSAMISYGVFGSLFAVVCFITGNLPGIGYSFYESNITIRNGLDFPFGVLCFVMELVLLYLANYGIIGWYDSTSNDFLFDKVDYTEYDKAAKRYYGIWRNRLILANVIAGAQLILGGFVTLTNAGEHLMGIRILGLVLLAIVFIYILIQSRNFEDPVVVKGMVYSSEKKRIALRWVILSAIALYILGAIILL